MINVGFRQSFTEVGQVQERYSDLKFPVEVALPWTWELYAPIRPFLDEIASKISSYGVRALSVHAVQAPISDDRFLTWGVEMAEFAKKISSPYVVIHPNKFHGEDRKEKSLSNVRSLTEQTGVLFCVETFESNARVLTIKDIIDHDIPMVLDTSHIFSDDKIYRILAVHGHNIPVIHLSARKSPAQHQPIDDFCMGVVKHLKEIEWGGNIVLEYLKEYHCFYPEDIAKVEGVLHDT